MRQDTVNTLTILYSTVLYDTVPYHSISCRRQDAPVPYLFRPLGPRWKANRGNHQPVTVPSKHTFFVQWTHFLWDHGEWTDMLVGRVRRLYTLVHGETACSVLTVPFG